MFVSRVVGSVSEGCSVSIKNRVYQCPEAREQIVGEKFLFQTNSANTHITCFGDVKHYKDTKDIRPSEIIAAIADLFPLLYTSYNQFETWLYHHDASTVTAF